MARDTCIDTNPRLLAVDVAAQLLPGTFEHAVHHVVTHELDLSRFDALNTSAIAPSAFRPNRSSRPPPAPVPTPTRFPAKLPA